MKEMTRLERLEATIAREPLDRVCVDAFTTSLLVARYSNIHVGDMRWNPKLATKAGYDWMKYGVDDFYYNTDLKAPTKDCGIELREPLDNHCSPKTEFFNDAEAIESKEIPIDVMDPEQTPWMNKGMLEKQTLARELWGDEYIIQPGFWGVLTQAGVFRGVEELFMDMMLEEDLVRKVVKKTVPLVQGVACRYAEAGVHSVMNADPTGSNDLLDEATYRKFFFDGNKTVTDAIKSNYDIFIKLHICGDTSQTCRVAPDMGVDFYSFDSQIPISHYKKEIGGRCAIMGNIPTMTVTMDGTVEKVMESARSCIEQGAKGGGYILGGACDAPVSSPFENLLAFKEAAIKYTQMYQ